MKLNRFYFNSVRIAIETFFVTLAFVAFFNNVPLFMNTFTVVNGIVKTLLVLALAFGTDVLFGIVADGIADRKSDEPKSLLRGVAMGAFTFATLVAISVIISVVL